MKIKKYTSATNFIEHDLDDFYLKKGTAVLNINDVQTHTLDSNPINETVKVVSVNGWTDIISNTIINSNPKLIISKSNNLFDTTTSPIVDNSNWKTTLVDGVYTIQHKTIFGANIPIINLNLKPNTDYTIKINSGTNVSMSINKDGAYNTTLPLNASRLFNSGSSEWSIVPSSSIVETIIISNIQLNEGTTALPYQPYARHEIALPDLTTQFPNGLGRLPNGVYDSVGSKRLGKWVAQNTDQWYVNSKRTNTVYVYLNSNLPTNIVPSSTINGGNMISNLLPLKPIASSSQDYEGFYAYNPNFSVSIEWTKLGVNETNTNIEIQNAVRNYLITNNFEFLYQLTTPIPTGITLPSVPTYDRGSIEIDEGRMSLEIPVNITDQVNSNTNHIHNMVSGLNQFVKKDDNIPISKIVTVPAYEGNILVGDPDGGIGTLSQSTFAPASHLHGNLTNDGKIGTTADRVIVTGTGGVLQAKSAGTTSQFMRGDGSWATPPGTITSLGLTTDQQYFSGQISLGFDNAISISRSDTTFTFSHSDVDGYKHVPATSTTNNGKVLTAGATAGSLSWADRVSSVALTVPTGFQVTGSPITTSGTLAISYKTQAPNIVLAGPSSGSTAAAPTFRGLVSADIPDLGFSKINTVPQGTILGRNTTGTGAAETITYANLKSYLNLNLVDNKSSATIRGENTLIRGGKTVYNVGNWRTTATPVETIIYTRIKWVSSVHMPVVHLTGYAYGLQSPVELKIGFYIYSNAIGYAGVTNMGAWNPEVYLFKHVVNSVEYVAIGLKGSCYYLQLSANVQDEMGNFANIELSSWTADFSLTTGVIPTATAMPSLTCCQVPYKDVYSPNSWSAPRAHAVNAATYGLGTTAVYGHVKTVNNLTTSAHADGLALSAYQGYLLNTNKQDKHTALTALSTTYAKGNIVYASAANTLSKLAVGTNGKILKVVSGLPSWETEYSYTHPTFSALTPSADNETTLSSVEFITEVTRNTDGHVTATKYKKLKAGSNISISTATTGDTTIALSGRIPRSNLPTGVANQVLIGTGTSSDPEYSEIKTINNISLIGQGNITVSEGAHVETLIATLAPSGTINMSELTPYREIRAEMVPTSLSSTSTFSGASQVIKPGELKRITAGTNNTWTETDVTEYNSGSPQNTITGIFSDALAALSAVISQLPPNSESSTSVARANKSGGGYYYFKINADTTYGYTGVTFIGASGTTQFLGRFIAISASQLRFEVSNPSGATYRLKIYGISGGIGTPELNIKTINTNNASALPVNSSESLAGTGTLSLHKVSKTGNYNHLLNLPTLGTVAPLNLNSNANTFLNGNGTWTVPSGGGGGGIEYPLSFIGADSSIDYDGTEAYEIVAGDGIEMNFQSPNQMIIQATQSSPIKTITTTAAQTLTLDDVDKTFMRNSSGAMTVNIPHDNTLNIPIGSEIHLYRRFTATVTVTAASGVILNGVSAGSKQVSEQYRFITVKKMAANEWVAFGALL